MKDLLNIIVAYLKKNIVVIITGILSLCVFIIVLLLYAFPLGPVMYAASLVLFLIMVVGIIDFIFFYKHYSSLKKLKNSMVLTDYSFPNTRNLIEISYQEIIDEINKSRSEVINKQNKSYSDMVDYYTIWAHQIKTPLSAMGLILQTEKSETNEELLEQLFKTEQYVEMVLQYLRLENFNSDLMFKRYSLDNIVKQAIRKYSKSFIRKKIKLNYEDLNYNVLTDEKWLVFVIEQLLSNSLKYTYAGEISIYMDENLSETLVIEDTGIGIEKEDIPRVFERGFTGYNGRSDKKSTGIGLYLCKQILNKLSHKIEIESETGKGSKVKICLKVKAVEFE